jgi:hypothetical protein
MKSQADGLSYLMGYCPRLTQSDSLKGIPCPPPPEGVDACGEHEEDRHQLRPQTVSVQSSTTAPVNFFRQLVRCRYVALDL